MLKVMNILLITSVLFSQNSLGNVKKKTSTSNRQGYKLTQIDKNGYFDRAGLKVGDVILKVNGEFPENPGVLKQLFRKPGVTEITIEREGKIETFEIVVKREK